MVVYFLPERLLPDSFYTGTEKFASFDRPEFAEHRFVMDDDDQWIVTLVQLIGQNPHPRRLAERPMRKEAPRQNPAAMAIPTQVQEQPKARGRREYRDTLVRAYRQFFDTYQSLCAQRMSGLFVVQATNHPVGELGFCRWRWTAIEKERFLSTGIPPRAAHHLPPDTEIVPICFYTQYAECTYQGPMLRAGQYRRLNSSDEPRLIVWDLGGHDTRRMAMTAAVIPSEDVSVTPAQHELLEAQLRRSNETDSRTTTPLLSSVLNTGLFAADYIPDSSGALAYSTTNSGALLEVLDNFLGTAPFEHPPRIQRIPRRYRTTLQQQNQRLLEQYSTFPLQEDPFEAED